MNSKNILKRSLCLDISHDLNVSSLDMTHTVRGDERVFKNTDIQTGHSGDANLLRTHKSRRRRGAGSLGDRC